MKYEKRSKEFFLNVKIYCPKHGTQRVYELWKTGAKKCTTVGCVKCFKCNSAKIGSTDSEAERLPEPVVNSP